MARIPVEPVTQSAEAGVLKNGDEGWQGPERHGFGLGEAVLNIFVRQVGLDIKDGGRRNGLFRRRDPNIHQAPSPFFEARFTGVNP
jgi:hypothetical protein